MLTILDWISSHHRRRRVEWARYMLNKYSNSKDWRRVRFSDEVHFGYGSESKPRILRRPWERTCADCVVERKDPTEKDQKKVHAWGAIGYDFKSELTFYDISSNTNGKMTQDAYIKQILEPIVLPWIRAGQSFVLEEDGDSGHGPSKHNPVRQWKEKNGLEHYINCALSPDLAPIENGWFPVKVQVRKVSHWDDQITMDLAREGWNNINQCTINKWIDSMPERLQAVLDYEGRITAF